MLISLFVFVFSVHAQFLRPAAFEQDPAAVKGLVFLSSKCPCSQSHVRHIEDLVQKFSQIPLYGVMTDHPETPQEQEKTRLYYSQLKIKIIQDESMSLVKTYGALKTPHVTLVKQIANAPYEIVYQGGVSDQHRFEKAQVRYLEDNLNALSQNQNVKHHQGHSLGCYIRRIQ